MKIKKMHILIVVGIAILYLVSRLFFGAPLDKLASRLSLSKAEKNSPYLHEQVEGKAYALKHVSTRPMQIYDASEGDHFYVLFDPRSNNFIVKTYPEADMDGRSGFNGETASCLLVKIDGEGRFVDSLEVRGYSTFFGSDVVFGDEGYVDWITTGDKTVHKYANAPSTKEMSEEDFDELFHSYYNQAEQMLYDEFSWRNDIVTAYFYINNEWHKLSIGEENGKSLFRDSEKYGIRIYRHYEPMPVTPLVAADMVPIESSRNKILSNTHYLKTHREPFRILSASALEWTGTAYYTLKYKGDILRFKVDTNRQFGHYDVLLRLYYPPAPYNNDCDIVFMEMSELSYSYSPDSGDIHHKGIGFYGIQKK